MAKTKHEELLEKASKILGQQPKRTGIDFVTARRAYEVETKKGGIRQGIGQLSRVSKPRYLIVSDQIIMEAIRQVEGTGIGVTNERLRIIKRASRKRV